ncbi:MAG: hypothetical protein M3220_17575 [Chloroflexota bacterium]|nr:hypothetical protein [Chloroflexota bacterium]
MRARPLGLPPVRIADCVSIAAVCSIAVLAACDARPVTGPSTPDGAIPDLRSATSSVTALGSGFLAAPPNSGISTFPAVQFATAPESTWVLIEVSGAIQTAPNPACADQPPYWPCPGGPIAYDFDSEPTSQGMGPVWICTNTGPTCGGLRLRGSGTATAIGLHYQAVPRTLYGKLNLQQQIAWNSLSGFGAFSYFLSGGYTVSATAIPNPLQLSEAAPDAEGMRTYSVQPLHGLQFWNPHGYGHLPAGMVGWYFFPGDSVSSEPSFAGSYRYVAECEYQTTCRYRPPGPGKMQAAAYVERQYAFVRNTHADPCAPASSFAVSGARLAVATSGCQEQQPKLKLVCSGERGGANTVIRGERIRCEAKKDPENAPGALTITQWSFEGEDRIDGELTSTVWEGVMVKSGTVQVSGTIGSTTPPPSTAAIEVKDRVWANSPVFTIKEVMEGEDSRLTLPPRVTAAHDLGLSNFFKEAAPTDDPFDPTKEVIGGPNHGLYYYGDLSFPIYAYYILNRAAIRRGSNFYNAQEPGSGGGGTRLGGFNWCSQSVVSQSLLDLVQAHELEHIRVYQTAVIRDVPPAIAKLEAMVSTEFSGLIDTYDAEFGRLDRIARQESNAIHQKRGNPNVTTPRDSEGECALKNEHGQELKNEQA